MSERFQGILAEIDQHLGPIYRKMGLKIAMDTNEEGFTVTFNAGKEIFSPVEISYYDKTDEIDWENASILQRCFEPLEVGNNNWVRWIHMEDNYRQPGKNRSILEEVALCLTTFEVVDLDGTKPKILQSDDFAMAWDTVREITRGADVKNVDVERDADRKAESYVFQHDSGRIVQVAFPFDLDADGVIYVDGCKTAAFKQWDYDRLSHRLEWVLDKLLLREMSALIEDQEPGVRVQ